MKLNEVPVKDIQIPPRMRQEKEDQQQTLEALRASIETEGLINPIAVQELAKGKFRLIAGERRLVCARELKWEKIPVHLYPPDLDENALSKIEFVENEIRKNLTWAERADATARLHKMMVELKGKGKPGKQVKEGWTQEKTAKVLGVSAASVKGALALSEAKAVYPELSVCKTAEQATKKLALYESGVDVLKEEEVESVVAGAIRDTVGASYILTEDLQKKLGEVKPKSAQLILYEDDHKAPLLKECGRILAGFGWLLTWASDPEEAAAVAKKLKSANFIIPCYGYWIKGTGGGEESKSLHNNVEILVCAMAGETHLAVKGRGNVFQYSPTPPQVIACPEEKPVELFMELIKTFSQTGMKVLSVGLSSGNSILAAANLKRPAFGFGYSKIYKKIFEKRLMAATPGKYTSYPGKN